MTLEPLTPAHAAVCAAVHAQAFPHGPWDGRAFAELLALPTTVGVVALQDGEPVAVLVLQVVVDEAEVLTIGVRPAWRRHGVAREMMAWAAKALACSGVVRLTLEVAAPNTAARALYAATGFAEVAVRRRYYADGADAVVMACDLFTSRAP